MPYTHEKERRKKRMLKQKLAAVKKRTAKLARDKEYRGLIRNAQEKMEKQERHLDGYDPAVHSSLYDLI
jgi:hypothetical protein